MTVSEIKKVVKQVAPAYPVLRVDLFGSYADGNNSEKSDVDLLVFFDEKVAGPLRVDSFLTLNKKVKLYEA